MSVFQERYCLIPEEDFLQPAEHACKQRRGKPCLSDDQAVNVLADQSPAQIQDKAQLESN